MGYFQGRHVSFLGKCRFPKSSYKNNMKELYHGAIPLFTIIAGWWFQIFFIFIHTWGRFPF